MPSRGQSLTLQFLVWDTSENAGKTGDVANLALQWVKDGVLATTTNAPSEVSPTLAPGVYKVVLTATECTCDVGTLAGVSTTAEVIVLPVTISFERLPAVDAGAAGGLATHNVAAGVKTVTDHLATMLELANDAYRFTALALAQASSSGGSTDWTDTEREQIRSALGVNGDKTTATGGQLQSVPSGVWSFTTRALTGNVGLSAEAIAAIWAATERTLTASLGVSTDDLAAIAASVWDYLVSGMSTENSIGRWLLDNVLTSTGPITLAGAAAALGPSVARVPKYLPFTVYSGGTWALCAEVPDWDGADAIPSDITSITYTIYQVTDTGWTEVEGQKDVAVTVANCVKSSLVSDWFASDWNLRIIPDTSTHPAFPVRDATYVVVATITPATGQKILVKWKGKAI